MEMCAAADQSWVSLPGKARAGFPCPGGATPVRAANPHLGLRGQPPGPSNEPSRETEQKCLGTSGILPRLQTNRRWQSLGEIARAAQNAGQEHASCGRAPQCPNQTPIRGLRLSAPHHLAQGIWFPLNYSI